MMEQSEPTDKSSQDTNFEKNASASAAEIIRLDLGSSLLSSAQDALPTLTGDQHDNTEEASDSRSYTLNEVQAFLNIAYVEDGELDHELEDFSKLCESIARNNNLQEDKTAMEHFQYLHTRVDIFNHEIAERIKVVHSRLYEEDSTTADQAQLDELLLLLQKNEAKEYALRKITGLGLAEMPDHDNLTDQQQLEKISEIITAFEENDRSF